jgi:HAD superfamily hydrolase (TIGR01509 family)
MPLHTVLLDIDGTLIDSNDAHAACWVEALAAFGHRVEFARVRKLIGMGGDKLLPELTGISKDSDDGRTIAARRQSLFIERYVQHLKAFPKAKSLLRRMREQHLELVVATSAHEQELDRLLELLDAGELLRDTTSSSEAKHSKPDQDIIEAALHKCGSDASEALMLGDTPYDIEAAGRMHVPTVALRCGGWSDEALKDAIAIYDSPSDLLARYNHSPFARPLQASSPKLGAT